VKKTICILTILLSFITNLEAGKRPPHKEIIENYKKMLKPFVLELIKRKNYFPEGTITKTSISKCYRIGVEQDGLSIPSGSNVKMINFLSIYREERKSVKSWIIMHKNKIYCIPNDNIKPKEKIIVMEGKGVGSEAFARYILLENDTYIQVFETLGPYGGGYPVPLHATVRGEYTRTENKITLCIKEDWSQSEFFKKKIKNQECTVLIKYTGNSKDFQGKWVIGKNRALVIEEYIFE